MEQKEMMARDRVKGKVPPMNSMATSENLECAVTRLKRAGRQVQRTPQRKVTEAGARRQAGEGACTDIGGLSSALCAVRFDVMSDDVDNDWTDVTRRY